MPGQELIPQKPQEQPIGPLSSGADIGKHSRIGVDSILKQGLTWEVVAKLLRENNGEEADGFLARLRQIDQNASDTEKTEALMEILNEYSGHTVRHSKLMRRIIENLEGFDDLDLGQLAEAAERHDIGKIGMPKRLLDNKGGEYDAEANHIKETHPAIGHLILRALNFDEKSARLALTHHLKYKTESDGKVVITGYPVDAFLRYCEEKGIKPELDIEDQITAFTDVFSALMDTGRPTDRFGTHGGNMSNAKRCEKAFEVMDAREFKDNYYLQGDGAPVYSAFKEAMLRMSESLQILPLAA